MIKRSLFVLAFLLCAAPAFAATYTATSCSTTAVAAAITAETMAGPASGDILEIPTTGSPCSWTTQVVWSPPANATLHCLSTINNSFSSTNFSSPPNDGSVAIVDDRADSHSILKISGVTGTFRMYGCTILKGSGSTKDSPGMLEVTGNTTSFRMDHCYISNTTGTPDNGSAAKFSGVFGVVDHNLIDLNSTGTGNGIKVGGVPGDDDSGNGSWNTATLFGSANFLYFEDDVITALGFGGNGHSNGALNDCDHGGKYVYRFNTIGSLSAGGGAGSQTHPTGGSGADARGCRATELYANNFQGADAHEQTNAMYLSSGSSLFWHNPTPNGYEHALTLHSTLKDSLTYPESDTPDGWGYCGPARQTGTVNTAGTAVTKASGTNFDTGWPTGSSNTTMIFIAGTSYRIASVISTTALTLTASAGTQTGAAYSMGSNWNENANTLTGGRCIDQPGNGIGDLLTGDAPNKVNHDRGDLLLWPRQALEPVYEFWNLPHACVGCDSDDFISIFEPSVEIANVNYYLHAGAGTIQTNATTPFDGTVGTGFGTLANRPTTCTSRVGYFVTDAPSSLGTANWNDGSNSLYTGDGALQTCISTNTWGTYYTPYTYPHPLIGGCSGASKLLFSAQPSSTTIGAALGTVTVGVYDSSDVLCDTATDTITIANKGGTCTGMTLGGTASGAASSGVFTTTNLTENAAGACTLSATASGLTGADSSAFTISAVSGLGLSIRLRLKGFVN